MLSRNSFDRYPKIKTLDEYIADPAGRSAAGGGAGGAEAQTQQAHPGDLIDEASDAREEEKTYREDDDMSLVSRRRRPSLRLSIP